jgi:hypothetical protein
MILANNEILHIVLVCSTEMQVSDRHLDVVYCQLTYLTGRCSTVRCLKNTSAEVGKKMKFDNNLQT